MNNDDENFLGDIGENHFRLWCSEAGITANKSEKDNKGWDFLVQFSNVIQSKLSRDKSHDEITAFIQVKTTRNPKTRVYMLLSNWNALVRSPVPAFVLYIVLDQGNNVKDVFLAHIDRSYIEATLREMRISKKNLNKKKLPLVIHGRDKISNSIPAEIKTRIRNVVGESSTEYARQKLHALDTVGFEELPNKASFTFRSPIADMVDFSIGIKREMPIFNGRMETGIRFGIPEKIDEFDSGTVTITPEGKPIELRFHTSSGLSVTVPARIFSSAHILPKLPTEYLKARLHCLIGDILYTPAQELTGNFSFNLDEEKLTRDEQVQLAKLILVFSNKQNGFRIDVLEKSKQVMSMSVDGQSLKEFTFDEETLRFCTSLHGLDQILRQFDIGGTEPFDLNEVRHFEQAIFEASNLVNLSGSGRIVYGFTLSERLEEPALLAIPRVIWFRIQERFYLFSVLYRGQAEDAEAVSDGFRYSCRVEPKTYRRWHTHEADKSLVEAELESLRLEAEKLENHRVLELK